MMVPNGIRPVLSPSMNTARPTITATRPRHSVNAASMGCCNTNNWNSMRYAARGTTAETCSIIRVEVYGQSSPMACLNDTSIGCGAPGLSRVRSLKLAVRCRTATWLR